MVLLSLNEIDRVKRLNGITSWEALEERSGVTRKTWRRAARERVPTDTVIQALYRLGARPERILVAEEEPVAAGRVAA